MSPIDKQLIERKIKLIENDLAGLKKYKDISLKEYLKNYEAQLVIERLLEKITGRLIDLKDYYDSFVEIGKRKVVTPEFAGEIAKSAGLRNALAHEYDKIDASLVHKAIATSFIQIPKYLKTILQFIENR